MNIDIWEENANRGTMIDVSNNDTPFYIHEGMYGMVMKALKEGEERRLAEEERQCKKEVATMSYIYAYIFLILIVLALASCGA